MDVIKERLQIEGQIKTVETYGGSWNAMKQIISKEGVLGLYRAYWMHQLTWAPFNGIYFTCFEAVRSEVLHNKWLPEGVQTNLASGVVAAIVASFSTSPIDLVKTRLQVQKSNPTLFHYNVSVEKELIASFIVNTVVSITLLLYMLQIILIYIIYILQGASDAFMKIVRKEGIRALFDGVGARTLWLTPRLSIAISVYNMILSNLKQGSV